METIESRKFLKRFPDTETIVKRIVNNLGIDYDNEDIFTWEIRSVKQPDKDSHIGTTTVYKLWINNEFVINVSPLTLELLKIIDELYPIPKVKLGNGSRMDADHGEKPNIIIGDDYQTNPLPKDRDVEPDSVNQ